MVTKTIVPKRGEVWLVRFDPTVGAEIQKTRPALILQNDIGNTYGATTIVAAITSHEPSKKLYPIDVAIYAGEGGLKNPSIILLDQMRTIDKARLGKKLGHVSTDTLIRVAHALKISLQLS